MDFMDSYEKEDIFHLNIYIAGIRRYVKPLRQGIHICYNRWKCSHLIWFGASHHHFPRLRCLKHRQSKRLNAGILETTTPQFSSPWKLVCLICGHSAPTVGQTFPKTPLRTLLSSLAGDSRSYFGTLGIDVTSEAVGSNSQSVVIFLSQNYS